jgi:hypothetical protein
VDVRWEVGQGETLRGEPGTVDLRLAQAPTGPRGSAIVAQLTFLARSDVVVPRDYLPTSDLELIEMAVSTARDRIRDADVPLAAGVLMDAYLAFARGQGESGKLFTTLDKVGMAVLVERTLLHALDVVSAPAETDVMLLALRDVDATLRSAVAAYGEALDKQHGVPILVETLSATDTRGSPLASADNVPGAVDVTLTAASGEPTVLAVETEEEAVTATPLPMPSASSSPVPNASSGVPSPARGIPVALLVALAVAATAGAIAVAWARQPD